MARKLNTPDTTQPVASPPVTFDPAIVNQMIAEAVAVALRAQQAEFAQAMAAAKPAASGKSDQSSKNELKTIAVFKKAGYGVVKPKVDVKTFNLWVAEGLRPKEGEHAKKINNLRLFHRSQCRPLTAEEKAGFKTKNDERVDAAKAKIIAITEASGAHQ